MTSALGLTIVLIGDEVRLGGPMSDVIYGWSHRMRKCALILPSLLRSVSLPSLPPSLPRPTIEGGPWVLTHSCIFSSLMIVHAQIVFGIAISSVSPSPSSSPAPFNPSLIFVADAVEDTALVESYMMFRIVKRIGLFLSPFFHRNSFVERPPNILVMGGI